MRAACSRCEGTGSVPGRRPDVRDILSKWDQKEETCPICEGSGYALPNNKQPVFFKLAIEMGNTKMKTARDVADALSGVAFKLGTNKTEGKILDVNGNSVGSFGFYK